jgi:signal transduction histidine kinase
VKLRTLNAESLRWTMGLYCAFVGAFILVAPHRFTSPAYQGLAPYRAPWGTAALVAGMALLATAVVRSRRAVAPVVHTVTGLTLLALAASFAGRGLWTGAVAYGVLGLGTAGAGFLRPQRTALPIAEPIAEPVAERPDLFALLMATIGVVNGSVLTLAPGLLVPSFYDERFRLSEIGLALLLGGALLFYVQLRRPAPRPVVWAAHLAAGGSFLLYGLALSLPSRSWTGVILYWGCGTVLAFLPWLSERLARIDTAALRTRLALALAIAASVSIILSVAVVTAQEERLANAQVIEMRRIEAQGIAQNVADYTQMNGARASALAALAARLPMEPEIQRELLVASGPSYPDVAGFLTLDARGAVLAASGGVPLDLMRWSQIADDLRHEPSGRPQIRLADRGGRTSLVLSAPIPGPDARLAGVLVTVFDADSLRRRIARTGSNSSLADGYGRLIARQEESSVGLSRLPAGWDREVVAGRTPATPDRLAAFARVPGLDWAVAVERSREAALAGVRQGRDLAFALLLFVVPLAVATGVFAARRIARPLGTLAEAVGQLTAGNTAAPLGTSDITEVARLSAAFRDMRDRLAERTRESESLAAELRARAEALAESDRRKDEFLAMLAHELRNPLGAIANASYVLEQTGPAEVSVQRPVAVIQRQIQHLVRLVDDLLDVSRITRGKVELRRGDADLVEVVRHAVETVRPAIEAKEHTLRVTLPEEPVPLHADATRLEQVVGNLLRNAAKYTEPGGRIEVEAAREDGQAVVRVRDNGVGIAPDLLPRVFDLFIQGDQTLDRSGGGLGIGLTLVRSLVEMHGGSVAAHSDGPGRGTEIVVRLPLAPVQAGVSR